MAGLPWIELATDLPRHRKAVALGLKIGDPRAWAYPAALWMWCAESLPEGRIDGEDGGAILEHAMGWAGEPGKLLQACVETGFIDRDGTEYVVHGWLERAAAHIAKRRKDAERQASRREQIADKFAPVSVTRESRGRPSESRRNSNPNPDPEPEKEKKIPTPTPQGLALDHWNAKVWPMISSAAPPKPSGAAMTNLHRRCKEQGLETVKAAMDRAASKLLGDPWLRENLTLQGFLGDGQFPKFLPRSGAASPPKARRAIGVDANGQPVFAETP
jgi:hypothetical protein